MNRRVVGLSGALAVLVAVLSAAGHTVQPAGTSSSRGGRSSVVVGQAATGQAAVEQLVTRAEVGRTGGRLVVLLRAEPRTLNPVIAVDSPSKDVVWRTMADLIHVNGETQQTEPALARSWTVSPDGRRFTLVLRRGVRFSDGDAFDADDVMFSFQVYMDEKVAAPQRDLLIVGGQPIAVRKIDQYTVQVDLAEPYAAAERLFHGLAMLPRHLLEKTYQDGRLSQAWALGTPPDAFAGLGPFRFKEHLPGQRIVLERNPYYWKADRDGNQLPYLEQLVFMFVPSEDAQAVRFQAGEADVTTRLSAANFAVLAKAQATRNYELLDAGPGLDYTFLFFNQNNLAGKGLAAISRKQAWFRQLPFREAVSLAIDREGIVRLVYRGKATPLWGHVPPGNKLWVNRSLPRPARSVERARQLLQQAGFSWTAAGGLVDSDKQPVEFTVVTNTGNTERIQIATIIQDDLKQLGMRVNVVTLELRALLDRLLSTHDYEACVLGLGAGDPDPYSEINVWLSSGSTHLWNLGQKQPATAWEAEIDMLMRQQLATRDVPLRKRLYDRVQELVAQNLPIISLVSPSVLVGATKGLGNLRPTIFDHHTLWNVEELFWRRRPSGAAQ
jgi:peptide/nickel transport system substrate-binding protein